MIQPPFPPPIGTQPQHVTFLTTKTVVPRPPFVQPPPPPPRGTTVPPHRLKKAFSLQLCCKAFICFL